MAEMTQDNFARSIGMTAAAFTELLYCLDHRYHLIKYIRPTLREQYGHRLNLTQLAAARQWLKDHPQD